MSVTIDTHLKDDTQTVLEITFQEVRVNIRCPFNLSFSFENLPDKSKKDTATRKAISRATPRKQRKRRESAGDAGLTRQNTRAVSFDVDEAPSTVIGRGHIKSRDIISDDGDVRVGRAE